MASLTRGRTMRTKKDLKKWTSKTKTTITPAKLKTSKQDKARQEHRAAQEAQSKS
jgi:hypothetical protein